MKKLVAALVMVGLASLFLVLPLPNVALAAPTEAWFTTQVTSNSLDDGATMVSGDRLAWLRCSSDRIPVCAVYTWSPSGGIVQLAASSYGDGPKVSGDRVVWSSSDGHDYEIYTWTPTSGTVRLTNNSYGDIWCDVSGDRVIWGGADAEPCLSVFMWTPTDGTVKLTTNEFCESIHVSGDRAVWYVSSEAGIDPVPGICTWTPAGGVQRLTTGYYSSNPVISGDRIVWQGLDGQGGIYTWTPTGGIVKIDSKGWSNGEADVSGDRVVWNRTDGTDFDNFTWTPGSGVVQLTSDAVDQGTPNVSGNRVVWSDTDGARAVYCWTPGNGTVRLPSAGIGGWSPDVAGDRVVWSGGDGTTDTEIFTAVAYPVTVPEITSVAPASGPTGGGTSVVINGSGFLSMSGAAAVKFGGTNATSYTVNSPTQITAVAPAHSSGKVDVTVTAAGGTSSAAGDGNDFLYLTRYQQTDTHLAYVGTWTTSTTSSATGSDFKFCNATGSVTASFTGTYLAWIAKQSPVYGKAKVTVDDEAPVTVDLYSPATVYQRQVWNTGPLDSGAHTVKIEWTGTKNASATDTNIGVDAFDVLGTLTQAVSLTRFQQTATQLAYAGTWSTSTVASASGGTFKYANTAGASVTVPFTGTYLSWLAKKSPVYGKAKVTVDGGASTDVDLYDAATLYQRSVWDTGKLSSGLHWVKIEWTGTKNASATDTNIGADAFDVVGSLTAASRFEQTSAKLVYSGTWTSSSTTSASGSSFKFANKSGASVTVKFTGISCNLIAKKSPVYGIAEVKLDDQAPVLVDFYSSSTLYKQTVWRSGFLAPGDHTVTIKWTGTKRTAATGYNINLDAVDVIGTLR
jgi:IPT/TIG domain